MGPVYQETKNATLAWQAGLFACFLSGVMEIIGAFFGDWLRRHTPRAALLSALAGIAITFIAMGFVFQIFATPIIGLLPMMLILVTYASRIRLPLGLPGGLVALLVGTAFAWGLRSLGFPYFHPLAEPYQFQVHLFSPAVGELFSFLSSPIGWKYLAVIFPMALFNVIGSLQNLESAEAAGDRFETRSSLLANGAGSLIAACLGSAFPTTIYIGHPGWKAMGARVGYSIINGAAITALCLVGGVTLVLKLVPLEATLGILLWIGLIITAQAFQETPRKHALAVAIGFIPSLAAWALVLIGTTLQAAGATLYMTAPKFGSDLYIHGIIALSQGFILTSMVLSAILAFIIDHDFFRAGAWSLAAALLSATGLIHAYTLATTGVQNNFGWFAAPQFVIGYGLTAVLLFTLHALRPREAARSGLTQEVETVRQ
jgi:adenine/guanine/hypoxanthine permease